MKNKVYNWDSIAIVLNGKEIEDIKVWKQALDLSYLNAELKKAEAIEDYETCAKLKSEIDKLT